MIPISSVQFCRSVMSDSLQPHRLQHFRLPCPSLSPGVCLNSCSLSQWCHSTIICRPLLPLASIFPSIRVFSNELALCIMWPKYWSFSFSISPSNGYSGLISFRIEWFDLLAVQGTLKSLLQHRSSKALILWCSAFFWKRKWQSTPVFLPGKFHGQRNLAGYRPWCRKESDPNEWLHTQCLLHRLLRNWRIKEDTMGYIQD